MNNLMIVPEDGSALDLLALRYRAAFDKTKAGREQWVEGTLELAVVVAEAKVEWPGNQAFCQWLQRHNLEQLHPNDRAALVGFSQDIKSAREMLEQSKSISWRVIWEKRPKAAPTKIGKSRKQSKHNASGSQKKKYIPTVMQEDNPPPPKPERKAVVIKALTREQVDPDFKGTALEFTTKYGHVTLHTKDEIKHHKRQDTLSAWLGAMADHERSGREMVTALDAVDQETMHEWLCKPGKAGKLQAWCKSIELACEKLRNFGSGQ